MKTKFYLFAFAMNTLVWGTDVSGPAVTFHKDILPILQKNCQSCHRPGQIAPMSFMTYTSTRPWAKAIKAAVASRKMPPWFADPKVGHFANTRALAQADVDLIAKWADNGSLEGNAKDAPPPVRWPAEGWEIQPDLVGQGPVTKVPASTKANVFEWTNITVPGPFKEDTWISSAEVKPNHLAITHHIGVFFKPHTSDVVYYQPEWVDKPRDENGIEIVSADGRTTNPKFSSQMARGTLVGIYAGPGSSATDYRPHEGGVFIPAGSDLVFQVHYTPDGTAVEDQPLIGFTVLKVPPKKQYLNFFIDAPEDRKTFAIPPNDPNWQSPNAETTFKEDATLVWMQPHMHVRGKQQTWSLVYPDGRTETILNVPKYDFNWQLGYELAQPIRVAKGTKLVITGWYDNSPNNKFNPDPNRTVYWGDMTWEEMMQGFFAVIVSRDVDPKQVVTGPAPRTRRGL